MNALMIRNCSRTDLPAVLECNQTSVPNVGSLDMHQLDTLYTLSTYFPIAQLDEQFVGFVICFQPSSEYKSVNFRWFKSRYERFTYIDRIALRSSYHRKGVGTRLYGDIEQLALSRKCEYLTCEINIVPTNEESIAFHAKLGFKEAGRLMHKKEGKLVSMQIKRLAPVIATQ